MHIKKIYINKLKVFYCEFCKIETKKITKKFRDFFKFFRPLSLIGNSGVCCLLESYLLAGCTQRFGAKFFMQFDVSLLERERERERVKESKLASAEIGLILIFVRK